jgi:hypothetical protein
MTGDAAANPSEPRKVLGLIWETLEDKLQVELKLNTGGKVGGARVQDDIDLEGDLSQALPGAITKRILWRVAQGLYDPLGLLCAFTIRFKIVMRSLSDEEEGGRSGWDDQVPAHVEANFREVLGYLKDLKKVNFPRSMWPKPSRGPVKGRPITHLRGRLSGGQLRVGLFEMGDGRWIGNLPPLGREDKGGAQVQDLHTEDGAYGVTGRGPFVPKDQRLLAHGC